MLSPGFLRKTKRFFRDILLKRWQLYNASMYGHPAYAQEGEDILLWRIIGQDQNPATYVDVGCNHPYRMSNTALLYERGWRGIAIDANPEFADEFKLLRPEDCFVNCGVSNFDSTLTYFRFEQPLYNTFDPAKAEEVKNRHSKPVGQDQVRVRRLDAILGEQWPSGCKIRLLSVDCEGLDLQVLQSHDFAKYPVEFIYAELVGGSLQDATDDPVSRWLAENGYEMISKLSKSALFWRQGDFLKWGVRQ